MTTEINKEDKAKVKVIIIILPMAEANSFRKNSSKSPLCFLGILFITPSSQIWK